MMHRLSAVESVTFARRIRSAESMAIVKTLAAACDKKEKFQLESFFKFLATAIKFEASVDYLTV